MGGARGHFNLRPRYSGGSPAMVDEGTAWRVASEEKLAHAEMLTGIWGPDYKKAAEEKGLKGAAYWAREKGKAWIVFDLITGDAERWPFEVRCSRCGFRVPVTRGRVNDHELDGLGSGFGCPGADADVAETIEYPEETGAIPSWVLDRYREETSPTQKSP